MFPILPTPDRFRVPLLRLMLEMVPPALLVIEMAAVGFWILIPNVLPVIRPPELLVIPPAISELTNNAGGTSVTAPVFISIMAVVGTMAAPDTTSLPDWSLAAPLIVVWKVAPAAMLKAPVSVTVVVPTLSVPLVPPPTVNVVAVILCPRLKTPPSITVTFRNPVTLPPLVKVFTMFRVEFTILPVTGPVLPTPDRFRVPLLRLMLEMVPPALLITEMAAVGFWILIPKSLPVISPPALLVTPPLMFELEMKIPVPVLAPVP